MKEITISVRLHFTKQQIADLLDSASRGSSYWCNNDLSYESETKKALAGGKQFSAVYDNEQEDAHCLDLKKIKKGLTVMAKKYPSHFADFLKEEYDQTTGDVFLQCCLFNTVLYS